MRTYRHISTFNVAGMVQQRGAYDYLGDRPLRVVSDRRKRKATGEAADVAAPQPGFFWRLTRDLRGALIRMSYRRLPEALKVTRGEKLSHDQEKLQRREEAVCI